MSDFLFSFKRTLKSFFFFFWNHAFPSYLVSRIKHMIWYYNSCDFIFIISCALVRCMSPCLPAQPQNQETGKPCETLLYTEPWGEGLSVACRVMGRELSYWDTELITGSCDGSWLCLTWLLSFFQKLKAFSTPGRQNSCASHISSLMCSGLWFSSIRVGWAFVGERGVGASCIFRYKKWSEKEAKVRQDAV